MSKTKIIIALVAVAALTLVLVGLVSAQVATTPNTTPNNGGFFGWMQQCLGLQTAQQPYSTNPSVTPQAPQTNPVAPAPNQGNNANGYGYGPCWRIR